MADPTQSTMGGFLRERKDLVVPVLIGLLMVVSIVVSTTVEPQEFPTTISDANSLRMELALGRTPNFDLDFRRVHMGLGH